MYKDMIREISLEYEQNRDRNQRDKDSRIREVYKKVPAVEKIDEEIRQIGLSMSKSILNNPLGYEEIAKDTKERIEKLKMKKAYLLTESNIPMDYMELRYTCDRCSDKGHLSDGTRCNCFKQSLVNRAYKMSNLENVLKVQNFQYFDIDLFSSENYEDEELTPRENMIDIVSIAEGFIDSFDENNGNNLLFYGSTGLGKTFLSNCIAKSLLDKQKIVIYQTAFTIMDILERRRFRNNNDKVVEYQYDLLFGADLLIIDDLGTELTNTFTNAEIFNIVNTRLIGGKKTIISTNLTPKEISQIYTDRVFSRIFDKFIPLKFYGKDLRWE